MLRSFKKLAVAAVLALMVAPGIALADAVQGGDILGISSEPFKTLTVSSSTASAGTFQNGSLILGFKLYANDAGDSCGLYDTAALETTTESVLIDEWTEATDEETNLQLWPRPYKLVTDLTVVTNGICVIYYQ